LDIWPEEEVKKVVDKVGVTERRFADDKTCASDLCCAAAEKLIADNSIDKGINEGINPSQKKFLDFISLNSGCSVPEISAQLNIPAKTIERHISVLLGKGVIERRGSKKTGGYYLVGNNIK